jgi:hypothetical protein
VESSGPAALAGTAAKANPKTNASDRATDLIMPLSLFEMLFVLIAFFN